MHYVRTYGPDGGVDPCEGPAIGLEVSGMVADGLPPWNVALEIAAGLAEILAICEEDDVVHGAVHPDLVFVDETGAVSLEGFGQPNLAPEGGPATSKGDAYGLGVVLAALVGAPPVPMGLDAEAHEDAVVDLILATELDGLPPDMHGDLQWFMGRLLARHPRDRPMAVEVWRTLLAFARGTEGPAVPAWCDQALDGEGERREPLEAPASEGLDGAMRQTGPLPTPMHFDEPTDPRPGTGMFTREQLRSGLQAAEAPQGVGGGRASGHWTQDQLAAMRAGKGAPAPQRAEGEVARARTMIVPKKVTAAHRSERGALRPTSERAGPSVSPVAQPPRRVAPASVTQPVPQVEEGSGRLVWVMAFAALCAVVAVLVCAGLGGMATVAALLSG
jgi:hypothetical protein